MKLTAKHVGGATQPVLARYRLRDIFGQTVYLSAPVLLAAPSFPPSRKYSRSVERA